EKCRIFKENWYCSEGSSPPLATTFRSAESLDFSGFPLLFCPDMAPIGDTSGEIMAIKTEYNGSERLHSFFSYLLNNNFVIDTLYAYKYNEK
ncbi:MAG: hypothetical protein NC341_09630, partial [Blautia sp.]|nr:hypothetical protein [Blautia sp.]